MTLFVLFLVYYDLRIALIPSFTRPACLVLISTCGALGFWFFPPFSHILSNLICAILSTQISGPQWCWSVTCARLVHREIFLSRYPILSEKYMSPWNHPRKPALTVFEYWSTFFQIIHPCSCMYCFASHQTSSHLESCEIRISIHDVPLLGRDHSPLKYCLILSYF